MGRVCHCRVTEIALEGRLDYHVVCGGVNWATLNNCPLVKSIKKFEILKHYLLLSVKIRLACLLPKTKQKQNPETKKEEKRKCHFREEEWCILSYFKEQTLDFSILLLLFLTVNYWVPSWQHKKQRGNTHTQNRKLFNGKSLLVHSSWKKDL